MGLRMAPERMVPKKNDLVRDRIYKNSPCFSAPLCATIVDIWFDPT